MPITSANWCSCGGFWEPGEGGSEFGSVFFNFAQIGLAAFDFDVFFVVFRCEIFDRLGRFFLQFFVYGYHLS